MIQRRNSQFPIRGSEPGRINAQDSKRALLVALIAAVSAFLVSVAEQIATFDLGSWEAVVIAGLAALIEAIRRWSTDNTTETITPPRLP